MQEYPNVKNPASIVADGFYRGNSANSFLNKMQNQERIEQEWIDALLDENSPNHREARIVLNQLVSGAFPDFFSAMVKHWWFSEMSKRGKDILAAIVQHFNETDSLTLMRPVDLFEIETELNQKPSEASEYTGILKLLPKGAYGVESFQKEREELSDLLRLTSVKYCNGTYVVAYDGENNNAQKPAVVDEYVEMAVAGFFDFIKDYHGDKRLALKKFLEVSVQFLSNYRFFTAHPLSCLMQPISRIKVDATHQSIGGRAYNATYNDGVLQIHFSIPPRQQTV